MTSLVKTKILSFDVSSVSTGWSVVVNGKPKKYGKILIDKKLSTANKLVLFKLNVINILCVHRPDIVVVEETYLRNVKTLKTLMQFIGVLNEVCLNIIGKELIFISPNTVRSYFKVKGKEEAFKFTNKEFKLKMDFEKDNDIADAILQGVYYYSILKENGNEE